MLVSLTCEVNMEFLYVQMVNVPQAARVKAAKVEEDDQNAILLAKDEKGQTVGKFPQRNVLAWWTSED